MLGIVRQEDFPPTQLGRAVHVREGDYWAYRPERALREVEFSSELVGLLDRATAALNRLSGVGRLLPNPQLLIAPHVRLEAVLSSRIEGTRSTVSDLLRFEAGDRSEIEDRDDVQEVQNYVAALDYGVERLRGGFPLSLRLLREIHERLMAGVRGRHATPGAFRRSQNWIGGSSPGDAAFVPPPVDEMLAALDDLESFLHERSLPLLIHLALAHYQFEVIHPFLDGNGRLGRLLIPLVLVERGVLPDPLLYLSVYFERNRDLYYDLLMSTSRTGDVDPWLKFFLRGVAEQAADAEERTVRLVELQAQLRTELLSESASMNVVRTAELLFTTPYLSATWLSERLDVTFPTAQSSIKFLVERGVLRESTGQKRNRIYFAEGIFDAVYGETMGTDQPTLFD